jgi:hypothetical protein
MKLACGTRGTEEKLNSILVGKPEVMCRFGKVGVYGTILSLWCYEGWGSYNNIY